MILSITRLKLTGILRLRAFLKLAAASNEQAVADPACLGAATFVGPWLVFWTATLWKDEQSLQAYVRSGAHRQAMPWLFTGCSEAATARWEWGEKRLPERKEIVELLVREPRFHGVRQPSQAQSRGRIPVASPWVRTIPKLT